MGCLWLKELSLRWIFLVVDDVINVFFAAVFHVAAIQVVREELMQCGTSNNQQPVLEEFIPLKKKIDDHGDDRESDGLIKEKDSIDKKNWMSSVQLWITDDHHPSTDYLFDAKQSFKLESKV
jgi:hypothetical protein